MDVYSTESEEFPSHPVRMNWKRHLNPEQFYDADSEQVARRLLRSLSSTENLDFDVNDTDYEGYTPLILVSRKCHPHYLRPIVETLLERGAVVNAKGYTGRNCLQLLCRYYAGPDLKSLVELLTLKGIDVNHKDWNGSNCLLTLSECYSGPDLRILAEFLLSKGIDVNDTDPDGWNSLHLLCRHYAGSDLSSLVEYMLSKGIDINARIKDGWNCLLLVCRYYSGPKLGSIVHTLLSHGVDIHAKTQNGWNCLLLLCKYYSGLDKKNLVELLVSKGVDVHAKNAEGRNCLYFLCCYHVGPDLKNLLEFLVVQGMDIKYTEGDEESLLLLVSKINCMSKHVLELINYLYERCSDLPANEVNKLLYNLARSGCWKSVRRLVDHADCLVKDPAGNTAASFLQALHAGSTVSLCSCCRHQVDVKEYSALVELLDQKTTMELPGIETFSRMELERNMPTTVDRTFWTTADDRQHRYLPQHVLQGLKNFKSNSLFSTLKSYVNSSYEQNPDWKNVATLVQANIEKLVATAVKLDPRFEGSIVAYGSSHEKTKLLLPDEFDFLLDLKHFQPNQKREQAVQYTGNDSVEQFYLNENMPGGKDQVSSFKLLYYFMLLLRKAESFSPLQGLLLIDWTVSETCVTLHLILNAKLLVEPFPISVDITLGVRSEGALNFETQLPQWCALADETLDNQFYMVPDRRWGLSIWKQSYPCLERDSILLGGAVVQQCLRLLKLLVALENWQLDGENTQLPTKTKPSSYAIKTCAFQYMEKCPPPWDDKDVVKHCLGICEFLSKPTRRMVSFYWVEEVCEKNYLHYATVEKIKQRLLHELAPADMETTKPC